MLFWFGISIILLVDKILDRVYSRESLSTDILNIPRITELTLFTSFFHFLVDNKNCLLSSSFVAISGREEAFNKQLFLVACRSRHIKALNLEAFQARR